MNEIEMHCAKGHALYGVQDVRCQRCDADRIRALEADNADVAKINVDLMKRIRVLEVEVAAGRKIYDQYRQGTRDAYEQNAAFEAALREIHLYMGRPSDTLRATVRSIVERVLTVPETKGEQG